jgi:hypothetical protein
MRSFDWHGVIATNPINHRAPSHAVLIRDTHKVVTLAVGILAWSSIIQSNKNSWYTDAELKKIEKYVGTQKQESWLAPLKPYLGKERRYYTKGAIGQEQRIIRLEGIERHEATSKLLNTLGPKGFQDFGEIQGFDISQLNARNFDFPYTRIEIWSIYIDAERSEVGPDCMLIMERLVSLREKAAIKKRLSFDPFRRGPSIVDYQKMVAPPKGKQS